MTLSGPKSGPSLEVGSQGWPRVRRKWRSRPNPNIIPAGGRSSRGRRWRSGSGCSTGKGGGIDRGWKRRPHLNHETMPSSASLGHAWVREGMEKVERFSSSGKGMK